MLHDVATELGHRFERRLDAIDEDLPLEAAAKDISGQSVQLKMTRVTSPATKCQYQCRLPGSRGPQDSVQSSTSTGPVQIFQDIEDAILFVLGYDSKTEVAVFDIDRRLLVHALPLLRR